MTAMVLHNTFSLIVICIIWHLFKKSHSLNFLPSKTVYRSHIGNDNINSSTFILSL